MNIKKVKRISAIVGIVLIISMYVISLISALFASKATPGLFLASIFSTVVIPIMIYVFIATYKYVHRNDKPKDTDIAEPSEEADHSK